MRRLLVFVLIFALGHTSAAFAAGPLEESARRAAEQLAQSAAQPFNRNTLLWAGASIVGAGLAVIALAAFGPHQTENPEATGRRHHERNEGWMWAGVGVAGLGATVMIIGASNSIQIGPNSLAYRARF